MTDKKLVVYAQCGLGDFYEMICMIPEIKRINNIKDENVHIYIDSIYFHDDKYLPERETTLKLLEKINKKGLFTIMYREHGSYHGLLWGEGSDWKKGIEDEKIKNDFLFYRTEATKQYMKERIDEDTIFIHSILGGNYVYEWKNGENKRISYKKVPIELGNKTCVV
ncbi:MAG: hypothetical protein ACFFG0_54655, partial [Candidatus Thorarchaeota archaeon]